MLIFMYFETVGIKREITLCAAMACTSADVLAFMCLKNFVCSGKKIKN